MSTKTTFKRVALVTVAALGFGVLSSVAPATAQFGSTAGAIALDNTSLTVVQNTQNIGVIRITLTDLLGAVDTLDATETITATVIGVPAVDTKTAAANFGDITFQELKETTAGVKNYVVDSASAAIAPTQYTDGAFGYQNVPVSNGATTATSNVYALAVAGATQGSATTLDKGYYTIRVRLTDSTSFIVSEKTIQVQFVSSIANAGAAIATTVTGALQKGAAIGYTTNNNIKAVLSNAAGAGKIFMSPATGYVPVAPTITAAITDVDGAVLSGTVESLTVSDTGTAGTDVVTTAQTAALNGTYGVTTASTTFLDTITAANTHLIRLRLNNSSIQSTATVVVFGTSTAVASTSTMTTSATGISVLNTATPYNVPITTTSATVKVTALVSAGVPATNTPITFTVAWSGNYNAGDVSPLATAVTTVYTDASGIATLALTNSSPITGGVATVTASGFASAATKSNVINWVKSQAATITVTPAAQKVKLLSTNVFTATVTDAFGAPVAGVVLTPAVSGANADLTSRASVTTGADGTATVTVTDAAALTTETDTITFTSASPAVSGETTVTYVTTVPVIATFTGYYATDDSLTSTSITTPVPTTGIYSSGTTKLVISQTRNYSKAITPSYVTTDELVAFRFLAKDSAGAIAVGVPVTVTAGTGGFLLSSLNLVTTSRTLVTDSLGYVNFVGGAKGVGAVTFTVASGAATGGSASIWAANTATTDARTVTLTGPATGTANGALVPLVVTVTDRNGNAVSSVAVSMTASGAGVFAGGATTQTFTTDSTGTFSFSATSYVSEGGAASYKAAITSTTYASSLAGYTSSTAVDSTLAAGASSATLTVTYAAGASSSDVAQTAADAAAEATDAANAATDAANAAAEAADAATAAAQDAADAVAALSAQMATLIAGLKAQMTALTNLVIKIQKKVKA
jgi:hypothetical protein